jgi:hypothetical protein
MGPAAKEEKKGKWSADVVLDHYSKLVEEIWEIVSALIGEAIVELVFLSAIRKLEKKHPFLSQLQVSEEGVALGPMREEGRKMAPVEIHRGFQSLITNLFDLFSALAEGVVSRELFPKVLPKVREAERLITQK